MIGETFYLRETFGQQQMVNRPKRRKSFTENELLNQIRLELAAMYAKKQLKDPLIEKEYKKGVNPKARSAYHVALRDYLNPPTVEYVNVKLYAGAIGDTITIKAKDDFKVVRVAVEILNSEGIIIESGDAARYIYKPFIWKYKASVNNPTIKGTVIKVVAFDRPGNRGIGEGKL